MLSLLANDNDDLLAVVDDDDFRGLWIHPASIGGGGIRAGRPFILGTLPLQW